MYRDDLEAKSRDLTVQHGVPVHISGYLATSAPIMWSQKFAHSDTLILRERHLHLALGFAYRYTPSHRSLAPVPREALSTLVSTLIFQKSVLKTDTAADIEANLSCVPTVQQSKRNYEVMSRRTSRLGSRCISGRPNLISRSEHPPLPILGDFARVESVFGVTLLIRLGFRVI